jgi:hypothetical protein
MDIKNVTKEEMYLILSESKSLREVILKFGLSPDGSGGYRNIKKKIISLGLIIPKYNYYGNHQKNNKTPNIEIFIENSTYPRQRIKHRIIQEKLIDYSCEICKNTGVHNGEPLSLQLDHKNGISDDNRIENLRFLCPNCHSQTPTYSGKSNKKKYICKCGEKIHKLSSMCKKCTSKKRRIIERPSIEELKKEVEKFGYNQTGKRYGVSHTTVRRWLK